jgi:hypothetical protein
MSTELSTSALGLSLDLEPAGRPVDNGLYNESADQLFWYGKRLMTLDGRVFRYSGSKTALLSGYGAFNYTTVATQNGAVLPYATLAGDSKIRITIANTNGYGGGAIEKDELVGGYIEIQEGAASAVTRMIVANDYVSTAGGVITVTLDGPLVAAYTVSSWADMVLNPYRYLGKGSLDYNAVMGVPTINRTSTYNGWIQTWGPCYVVAGGGDTVPGNSANDRMVGFVGDGTVNGYTALTVESGYQPAGFIIDSTASGTGAVPLVMLQISI